MKYELVKTDTKQFCGRTLYRIRALVAIGSLIAPNDLGGYIESEKNLSQMSDNAWVYDNAQVFDDARVFGNARVSGDARVSKQSQWLLIGPAKSSGRFTTAFVDEKLGVRVVCGCFTGTIAEFSEQIEKSHKDNKEHLEQYRLFCQLIGFNFEVQQRAQLQEAPL